MSDRKDHYDDPFAFKTLAGELDKIKKRQSELTCEYGSSHPVRFLDPDSVSMINAEGEEVCIPKCQKCGIHKCQVIGENAYMWFCAQCGSQ